MRLRTLGLIVGVCIGAVTGYARAEGTLIGHRMNETLRLFDKPCTNSAVLEKIHEAEAALKMELVSAFKQGEYLVAKEAPMAVCYRTSLTPDDTHFLFVFEDGGTGSAPRDEFTEEAI